MTKRGSADIKLVRQIVFSDACARLQVAIHDKRTKSRIYLVGSRPARSLPKLGLASRSESNCRRHCGPFNKTCRSWPVTKDTQNELEGRRVSIREVHGGERYIKNKK